MICDYEKYDSLYNVTWYYFGENERIKCELSNMTNKKPKKVLVFNKISTTFNE